MRIYFINLKKHAFRTKILVTVLTVLILAASAIGAITNTLYDRYTSKLISITKIIVDEMKNKAERSEVIENNACFSFFFCYLFFFLLPRK